MTDNHKPRLYQEKDIYRQPFVTKLIDGTIYFSFLLADNSWVGLTANQIHSMKEGKTLVGKYVYEAGEARIYATLDDVITVSEHAIGARLDSLAADGSYNITNGFIKITGVVSLDSYAELNYVDEQGYAVYRAIAGNTSTPKPVN